MEIQEHAAPGAKEGQADPVEEGSETKERLLHREKSRRNKPGYWI